MNYKPFQSLTKGSHIRILCAARAANTEKLEPAIKWLKSLGYRVSLGKTIGKQHHQFGGTREQRLEDIHDALQDPDVNAIWIARGGYGSIQIVDDIDTRLLTSSNTQLIGYSDVTVLHALWQQHGLQSIHAFMPLEWHEKESNVLDSFIKAIKLKRQTFTIANDYHLSPVIVEAPVVGGNLSVLCSLLGSSTFPKHEEHILFIEDLDELLYHIDRLMTMLKRAGKLNRLKALLVGGMTSMRDHDIPFGKNAREIIEEHTKDSDYPVIYNFPAGHLKDNHSFTLGKMMQINVSKDYITITQ